MNYRQVRLWIIGYQAGDERAAIVQRHVDLAHTLHNVVIGQYVPALVVTPSHPIDPPRALAVSSSGGMVL